MSCSGEEMVSCPYDNLHRVLRKHLQKHLLKCKLNHPEAEVRTCVFNASHVIPETEYEMHVISCPDRSFMTKYQYATPTSTRFEEIPKSMKSEDRDTDEENWDNDEYETYDPEKYASSAPVIRSNIGNMPSQRKEFRKNELDRFGKKLTD